MKTNLVDKFELDKLVIALATAKTDDRWYEWHIYFRHHQNEVEVLAGHVAPLDRDIKIVASVLKHNPDGSIEMVSR